MILGKLSPIRHVVVGAAIATTTLLGFGGVIGGGNHEEVIEHLQVIVEPAGADGLRITETFDQDFGTNQRHGTERRIPIDFGVPTDVVASSPDAPDDVSAVMATRWVRIRVGDPNEEISGQHRYVLSYTLPEAQLSDDFLALDVMGNDYDLDMREVDVIVTGFVLDEPRCFTGRAGSTDQCDVTEVDGTYRMEVAPLPAGEGITIDGRIEGRTDAVAVAPPPLPDRRETNRGTTGISLAVLGLVGSIPTYLWARKRGRNEVYAGGTVDAAFGDLPPPGSDPEAWTSSTQLVHDTDMDDFATIEFVPPPGIEPWEGAVLLSERMGDSTISAYLSGMAAREAIELAEEDKSKMSISKGPKFGELDPTDAALLGAIFAIDDPFVTGEYSPKFATAWSAIGAHQRTEIQTRSWWKHGSPADSSTLRSEAGRRQLLVASFIALFFGWSFISAFFGWLRSFPVALVFGLVFPMLVAYGVYRAMLPSRTAQGSALTIRAESFRRFLAASEGQHVEWAWEHGMLREYSAWAVALDEADAWSAALDKANVPAPARLAASPMFIYAYASSMGSARTAPSSSGSGGGGGFSGGSVGGGGGGGGGGSW